MDIHSIRQQMRTRSIYDLPLRVTYYARVSSESDEQLNSLGNQIQYYEELIKKNTRNYAKRQLTYFKRMENHIKFTPNQATAEEVIKLLQ